MLMTDTPKLRRLAPDLWDHEAHFFTSFMHLRIRMTVVRLGGGGLLLYSPVPIDEPLADELAAIGPVEHILAPSCFHHLHARTAKQRYPRAKLWAAPGLRGRKPDIPFDADVSDGEQEWSQDVEVALVRGVPRTNEVVLFHSPSRSLICADLVFNIQEEPSWITRGFWRLLGVWKTFGVSRAWRLMVKDRAAFARTVDAIVAWNADRIVMAHGSVVEGGAERLREALSDWQPPKAVSQPSTISAERNLGETR